MAPISLSPDHATSSPSSSSSSSSSSCSPDPRPIPHSILIIGAGVFGLSTALALATRPEISPTTSITIIDRSPEHGVFPARDASSIDTSRIIRADYADPAYAALAAEAQAIWRQQAHADDLGAQGRYSETGLLLVGDAEDDVNTTTSNTQDHEKKKKTGLDYVRASFANVQSLHPSSRKITALPSREAIRTAYGTGGATGTWGYLNSLSGWADADASMAWLLARARATNRVTFIHGNVTALLPSPTSPSFVCGVRLASGATHTAALTILATGAWTPTLLPELTTTGRAIATGQVLAYVPLTAAEQGRLANVPTLLNLTSGYFIITPSGRSLKIARHAYGYLNPVRVPVGDKDGKKTAVVSAPLTHLSGGKSGGSRDLVPFQEQVALRKALREMVPWGGIAERPFSSTRLCWYTDTPDGDFIIDHHPEREGLFVATGASGHGFKFLPVIGNKIVDCVLGQRPDAFRGKWDYSKNSEEQVTAWDQVVTEDGSRGGKPGLVLEDEVRKGATSHL